MAMQFDASIGTENITAKYPDGTEQTIRADLVGISVKLCAAYNATVGQAADTEAEALNDVFASYGLTRPLGVHAVDVASQEVITRAIKLRTDLHDRYEAEARSMLACLTGPASAAPAVTSTSPEAPSPVLIESVPGQPPLTEPT